MKKKTNARMPQPLPNLPLHNREIRLEPSLLIVDKIFHKARILGKECIVYMKLPACGKTTLVGIIELEGFHVYALLQGVRELGYVFVSSLDLKYDPYYCIFSAKNAAPSSVNVLQKLGELAVYSNDAGYMLLRYEHNGVIRMMNK